MSGARAVDRIPLDGPRYRAAMTDLRAIDDLFDDSTILPVDPDRLPDVPGLLGALVCSHVTAVMAAGEEPQPAPAAAAEPAPAAKTAAEPEPKPAPAAETVAEPKPKPAPAASAAPAAETVAEPEPKPAPQASAAVDVDEPGDDSAELEHEDEQPEGVTRKRRGIRLKQDLG